MQGNDSSGPGSVVPAEIARFDRLAAQWWDPNGPMRPLHRMNPLRVAWTQARLAGLRPASGGGGLRLLDLGCGAGLASEALAALGHDVLGVDAAPEAIDAARAHAALRPGLGRLEYRRGSAEALREEGLRFDAVVALEVIEHVADPSAFLRLLADLLHPGGLIVLSTLNRTVRSLATAKLGAEYVLRLLPIGTHDWRRFVTPVELARQADSAGLRLADIAGMVPGLGGQWRESRDLAVNYIAALQAA